MKEPKVQVSKSRRDFLRTAGISGGVAAVAATVPAAAVAESADDGGEKKATEGYRLTSHILAYYKSAAS